MSNKITILAFSFFHGGAEKVCITLCNKLIERNYSVELWVADSKETALSRQLNKKVEIRSLNRNRVRTSIFPLIKLFIQNKPEKIIVFHLELAVLAIAIKKLFFLKTKIITRSINTLSKAFGNSENFLKKYLTNKMINFVLNNSEKIIAQSSGMYRDLVYTYKVKNEKIRMIHNPAINISVNRFNFEENMVNQNEFLFIGRLKPQKGLTTLIKIFEMAHTQNPNIILTIVGEGPEEERLKKMAEMSGLTHSIRFEGYQAHTERYYKRAKATVLTSVYEGFPNVLVESIAVGTPVVAFNFPSGPEDIIVPGVNGILVPNMDSEGFTDALLALAHEKIKFDKKEVIESAKKFSVEEIVSNYEQVYLES